MIKTKIKSVEFSINNTTFTLFLIKDYPIVDLENKIFYVKEDCSYDDIRKVVVMAHILTNKNKLSNDCEITDFICDNFLNFQCDTNALVKLLIPKYL
jgi:hypothetical protein